MLFWLICALLTAAVIALTLRPLLSRSAPDSSADAPDLGVYKDQLAEVERDAQRGLLSGAEIEAATLEIKRRILALDVPKRGRRADAGVSAETGDGDGSGVGAGSDDTGRWLMALAAVAIVASSFGLYAMFGAPGYPGQPHAERAARPAADAPVGELIARVEARLREVPDDGAGWDVLGPVYLKQGRNQDAIQAFRRAIELRGENRARLRGLAEAYLAETNGIVVPEVREAFQKILVKEPGLIAPRFWLAVGREQDGDHAGAAAAYRALLGGPDEKAKLPPPLKRLIEERLAAVTGKAPPPPPTTTVPADAGKGAPPPAGMADGMSAAERSQMIEGMVKGLAERLGRNGGTRDEWQRLMRAYWVLGRRDQAADTLSRAKRQFADNADAQRALDAFARALGMSPG